MSNFNTDLGNNDARVLDPAAIEAAMQRGRVERSKAFHAALHTLVAYVVGTRATAGAPAGGARQATGASAC